jgi:hypothetical protein
MQEPMVGTAITATLTDADGGVTAQMWQWEKSMNKSSWMDATGTGATTRSYTPVAADESYYLRATVEYTDAVGSGRMAESMATGKVTLPTDDHPQVVQDYNTNNDDVIDINEVIAAVEDYQDDIIDINEVIAVVEAYQSS